jgi:hypothetical protein
VPPQEFGIDLPAHLACRPEPWRSIPDDRFPAAATIRAALLAARDDSPATGGTGLAVTRTGTA